MIDDPDPIDLLDDLDEVDQPWFCEAKDRDPASEHRRQGLFLSRLAAAAPKVLAIAIPNAGRMTDWERLRRWSEGAVAGATDLIIVWPGGVFFAEFKDGTKMPSKPQRAMLNLLHSRGHHCGVYRMPSTLLYHLRNAGAPFLFEPTSVPLTKPSRRSRKASR